MPPGPVSVGTIATAAAPSETGEPDNNSQVRDWLAQVGLGESNPFVRWDAGADPDLSRYLVRHDVFRTLWHDSPAAVFAPAGGGKSAFRVRLAYACRVGEDGRRVFAIPYVAPEPSATTLGAHLQAILENAAQELLLNLVYKPGRFEGLDAAQRQQMRRVFDRNAPGLLDHFLPQIEQAGGVAPLVETFDPSAAHLPAPARAESVRVLCNALRRLSPVPGAAPPAVRFRELVDLLLNVLDFEAIYLLVDGVDAFPETIDDPVRAEQVLAPLLAQMEDWADRHVFLKLFLPIELYENLAPLTEPTKVAIITWKPQSLIEVLHARLRVASGGQFDSLDAISAPSLRYAESLLIQAIPPVPRELLVLVNQVIVEHVRRLGATGGLEPEDVEAAVAWYHSQADPLASSP